MAKKTKAATPPAEPRADRFVPGVWRDPRLLEAQMPERARGKRLCLGIDLGTDAGFAFAELAPGVPPVWAESPVFMGRWDLSVGSYESGALRLLKLKKFLRAVSPDFICFEEIRNTPGGETINRFNLSAILARVSTAAQLAGALMGVLALWAEEEGIPCAAIPIGTIKKRATGRGNASKEDVAAACNEAFGTSFDLTRLEQSGDHNVADAAWVLVTGAELYVDGFDGRDDVHAGGREAGPPGAGPLGGADDPAA